MKSYYGGPIKQPKKEIINGVAPKLKSPARVSAAIIPPVDIPPVPLVVPAHSLGNCQLGSGITQQLF